MLKILKQIMGTYLLRVVINVLTKVKQQKDNKCAHF